MSNRFKEVNSNKDYLLLTTTPKLKAYLNRIGAEQKNFRRYEVEGEYIYGTQRKPLATITIVDGKLKCTPDDDEYGPTKEERADIEAELSTAGFPHSITATHAQRRDLKFDAGAEVYNIINRSGDIVMVQEVVRSKLSGKKQVFPWTFWSDGKWRNLEPDGKLPFWKPAPNIRVARLMIHEGAKSAQAADRIANDPNIDHPWKAELQDYEHWGMIGGALAPHRADYSEIHAQKPVEVVYCCDNDMPGIGAAPKVSKMLLQPMKALVFDERFDGSFDLADPFPENLYRGKRYIGPTMHELLRPATWATEKVKSAEKEKGRPGYKTRDAFAEEWWHVSNPGVFVHRDHTERLQKLEEFNRAIRPFSDADDTARLLVHHFSSQVDKLAYRPGQDSGVIAENGDRILNTYRPGIIKPNNESCDLWLEFMAHLIPDEKDRHETMRWCATLIARAEVRMKYGMLLISEEQGVGKGTLGEKILAPLVGLHNSSFPSEHDIVDSQFNSWIAHKRLAVVHEIYAGRSHNAYNKIKSLITDKHITSNTKHIAAYTIENELHILACSNSIKALSLVREDRRWFVPRVTEEKRDYEYWKKLNHWLNNGGLGAVRKWADTFKDYVEDGQEAPPSKAKDEIIAESRSPGGKLAYEFAELVKETNEKKLISLQDLRSWVKDMRGIQSDSDPKLESLNTLRKAVVDAGLKPSPKGKDGRRQRFKTGYNSLKFEIVANFTVPAGATWEDLKEFYVQPGHPLWPKKTI